MWVKGHSRPLKVVPFKNLGTASYSPSLVTMAVYLAISEIFSVKEWSYLEILVWPGRSRSLEMARSDGPCMTFYWSAIATIFFLYIVPFSSYLTLNNTVTLKSGLEVTLMQVIQICAIRNLGCGFLFAFYSNYGCICSHLRDIQCQYDMIWYDSVHLTCSKKLTGSQLSLPHGISKKLKCETKNKMMSVRLSSR